MGAMTEVAAYLVNTLASLYLIIVIMRFLLQLARADFYNPISQFVVKASDPLVKPLRRVIPGFGGIDLSTLVLALGLQFLVINLLVALKIGLIGRP